MFYLYHLCDKSYAIVIQNIIITSNVHIYMVTPVCETKDILVRGAEAEIWSALWWGREAVLKKRTVKGYRHPVLDSAIRKERLRKEIRLMREARKAGVPVPVIYDVLEDEAVVVMQFFPGDRVLDCLEKGMEIDLKRLGRYIGKLHSSDITHGDLTTSNILFDASDDAFCFIDFSLGERTSSIEDKGVDLHLMREALISVHEKPLEKYESILTGYREVFAEAEKTISKVKDIESRGRYL